MATWGWGGRGVSSLAEAMAVVGEADGGVAWRGRQPQHASPRSAALPLSPPPPPPTPSTPPPAPSLVIPPPDLLRPRKEPGHPGTPAHCSIAVVTPAAVVEVGGGRLWQRRGGGAGERGGGGSWGGDHRRELTTWNSAPWPRRGPARSIEQEDVPGGADASGERSDWGGSDDRRQSARSPAAAPPQTWLARQLRGLGANVHISSATTTTTTTAMAT